ncbi:MAG: hypothetical protein ABIR79_17285 [Candidatus Binatia bacterium]
MSVAAGSSAAHARSIRADARFASVTSATFSIGCAGAAFQVRLVST